MGWRLSVGKAPRVLVGSAMVPGGMVTLIKSSSWRPGLNSLVNILAGGVGLNLREVYRANL